MLHSIGGNSSRRTVKPFTAFFVIVFMLSMTLQSLPFSSRAEAPACDIAPLAFGSGQAEGVAPVSFAISVPNEPARVALVMAFVRHDDRPPSGAVFGGVPMTFVASTQGTAWTHGLMYLYALANPPAGSAIITVEKTALTTLAVLAHVYGGVDAASLPETLLTGQSPTNIEEYSAISQTQSDQSWLVSFWNVNNANGEGEQADDPITRRATETWIGAGSAGSRNWLVGYDRGPLSYPSIETVTERTPGRPGAFAYMQLTLAADSDACTPPTASPTIEPTASPEATITPTPTPVATAEPTPVPAPPAEGGGGGGSAAILSLELTLGSASMETGGTGYGNVTIHNTGNSPDSNVVVTVMLPDGFMFTEDFTIKTFVLPLIRTALAAETVKTFPAFSLTAGASQSFVFGFNIAPNVSSASYPVIVSVASNTYGTAMYQQSSVTVASPLESPMVTPNPEPALSPEVAGVSTASVTSEVPMISAEPTLQLQAGSVLGASDSELPETGFSLVERAFVSFMLAIAATGTLLMLLGIRMLPAKLEGLFITDDLLRF